jgi:hypothetical protein
MNDEQYLTQAREQFQEFSRTLIARTDSLEATDTLRELAMSFDGAAKGDDDLYQSAPALVERLFTTYPDFAPTVPRELLWFLGGECLHYMPDEEIALYQQLDEMRDTAKISGKVLDFQAARAKLMKSK